MACSRLVKDQSTAEDRGPVDQSCAEVHKGGKACSRALVDRPKRAGRYSWSTAQSTVQIKNCNPTQLAVDRPEHKFEPAQLAVDRTTVLTDS